MEIREIKKNKKQFISLLLLADEQENMIDRYLDRGAMFVLDDGGVRSECVVTDEGEGVLEIKNIATYPVDQRKDYASSLIQYVAEKYRDQFSVLRVGTGDSPATVPFNEKLGFVRVGCIKNFFRDNYNHPIIENGVQLVDMIILQRRL